MPKLPSLSIPNVSIPSLSRAGLPIPGGSWRIPALVAGALISGGLLAWALYSRNLRKQGEQHVDKLRDKAIKDSFPASDPPASQYFDIPVNRQ